ncbi:MAG TPA: RNA-binding protein [Candidatus Saccharimonadales bacterium]|nr:RNA-binding protein [Candidatus Saccharimonadales bacterium]
MYKLFVGGLPWTTTDEEFKQMFADYKSVASANVVPDREHPDRANKGFGFVEFEDAEEGKAAEKALNGTELNGRTISVAEARPKEDRPRENRW